MKIRKLKRCIYCLALTLSAVLLVVVVSCGSCAVSASKAGQPPAVVCLTFDDGPSSATERILEILKDNNVKATFFVTAQYKEYISILNKIAADGHKIAVHTYSHNYSEIYSSSKAFWADQAKMRNLIFINTATSSSDFRFPGGSSNAKASKALLDRLISESVEKGYRYHDWNVDSGDANGIKSPATIYNNIIDGINNNVKKGQPAVILMHDIPTSNTSQVLDRIIKQLKEKNCIFLTVNNLETPVTHSFK